MELMAILTLLETFEKKNFPNTFFSYIATTAVKGLTFTYLPMRIT